MSLTVKVLGLILLFLSFSYAGFMSAKRLSLRAKALKTVCSCLRELEQRLRYEGFERERLIKLSFEHSGVVLIKDGAIHVTNDYLEPQDKAILEEFFMQLGSGDEKAEEKRVGLCIARIEDRAAKAQRDAAERGRIYRTVGICAGAAVCLILL